MWEPAYPTLGEGVQVKDYRDLLEKPQPTAIFGGRQRPTSTLSVSFPGGHVFLPKAANALDTKFALPPLLTLSHFCPLHNAHHCFLLKSATCLCNPALAPGSVGTHPIRAVSKSK